MTIYVLCGLPASGKTTLSEELAVKYDAKLFHHDDYRGKKKLSCYAQIKKELDSNNIVLDGLFLVKAWREELLEILKDVECEKILIKLETPIEECIERNKERKRPLNDAFIYHLNKRYQEPTLDEGWNDIQYIK